MSSHDQELLLIGMERTFPDVSGPTDDLLTFHGDFFQRSREIRTSAEISRFIRYEHSLHGGNQFLFLGLTVPEILSIPEGMTVWRLGPSSWDCIRPSDKGHNTWVRTAIGWRQPDRSPGAGPHAIPGDFFLCGSPSERSTGGSVSGDFRLTAYACRDQHRKIEDEDRICLAEYNPEWPEQYARFSSRLREYAGPDLILRTEHYGSTAVPGISAKPIIDVLAEISSFSAARARLLPLLLPDNRWEYWWYENHMTFIRRENFMGRRTYHLHAAPKGHRIWEQLAFRDYLKTHPGDAERYAALKRDLAEKYPDDRERYTRAKTEFIRTVLGRVTSG